MVWLWFVAPAVLAVGAVLIAVATRTLAEEAAALSREASAWRTLPPALDEVATAARELRSTAGALGPARRL